MEGRSLFIVMAPPAAKAAGKDGETEAEETIGDAMAAQGQVPEVAEEPPASAPA
jgi:hypothetical protein